MKNLTIKHLRYFEALARYQHFGRAADACAISQPALSLQIKDLERILGAPLIERSARRIHPTTFGLEFLDRARHIISAFDDLADLARTSKSDLQGTLNIGIIPTIAPYLLPKLIKTVRARFPGLDLYPREAITQTLISDLLESKLDLAIVALPISEPTLQEFALFKEDFVFVRPAADAHLPVPSPSNLKEMRLLLLEEGHCFRDQALAFCSADQMRPRDIMEGSSLSTIVQMVGAGLGVTLIPEMAVAYETLRAEVSIARFDRAKPARTVGMVWRKTTPLSKQLMDIGAAVRSVGTTATG